MPYGLLEEDLVSFETKHIHKVIPDLTRMKLPPFMRVTHFESKDVFVLHTAHPRLIAMIQVADRVEAKEALWIDERCEHEEAVSSLLKKND